MDDAYVAEPVDEARRMKLAFAALAVLSREESTPLERQWAKEVFDLCAALGEERSSLA